MYFCDLVKEKNLNKEMIPMNGIASSRLVPPLKNVSHLSPPIIKNPIIWSPLYKYYETHCM